MCEPEPVTPGTPCGDGDGFTFEICNQGPGICSIEERYYGDLGVCVGVPTVGASCNDNNQCTKDDACMVVTNDHGFLQGVCSGTFDGDLPCNGSLAPCSSPPRYVLFRNRSDRQ
jgi:hypothetical protein